MNIQIDNISERVLGNSLSGILPQDKEDIAKIAKDPKAFKIFKERIFDVACLEPVKYASLVQVMAEFDPKAWKWFIRKNCEQVKKGCYGSDPNKIFGTMCHEAVIQQLKKMDSEAPSSLFDLVKAFAKIRHEIAIATNTPDSQAFGQFRFLDEKGNMKEKSCLDFTDIKEGLGHYLPLLKNRLIVMIQRVSSSGEMSIEEKIDENISLKIYELPQSTPNAPLSIVTSYNKQDGKEEPIFYIARESQIDGSNRWINRIALSSLGGLVGLNFHVDPAEGMLMMLTEPMKDGEGRIYHCPMKNIVPFMEAAEKLYQEVSISHSIRKLPSTMILDKISEIQSILSNSMPTNRGSDAIIEMVTIFLLLRNGFRVSPYKEGVIGNMEALTRSKHDFKIHFNFFRQEPLEMNWLEKKIAKKLGGPKKLQKLPFFQWEHKHHGFTDYMDRFQNSEMTANFMRGIDDYSRQFFIKKTEIGDKPLVLFQRFTHGFWMINSSQLIESEDIYEIDSCDDL